MFQKKTSAVDSNFIVNVQLQATTLLKLYSKTVFSGVIFGIFEKNYFQISSPITEAYLEPNWKSMMELFGENS